LPVQSGGAVTAGWGRRGWRTAGAGLVGLGRMVDRSAATPLGLARDVPASAIGDLGTGAGAARAPGRRTAGRDAARSARPARGPQRRTGADVARGRRRRGPSPRPEADLQSARSAGSVPRSAFRVPGSAFCFSRGAPTQTAPHEGVFRRAGHSWAAAAAGLEQATETQR